MLFAVSIETMHFFRNDYMYTTRRALFMRDYFHSRFITIKLDAFIVEYIFQTSNFTPKLGGGGCREITISLGHTLVQK
jgi:hypothetical protein